MTNPIGNPPGAENSLASENEQLRKDRDAAEIRYIEARDEAASLEQQVADLQQELFLTKQKHLQQQEPPKEPSIAALIVSAVIGFGVVLGIVGIVYWISAA